MSAFPGVGPDPPPAEPGHHQQFDLYAHVEGLCAEEDRLLETAEHERTEQDHARLNQIRGELDRLWERLGRRRR